MDSVFGKLMCLESWAHTQERLRRYGIEDGIRSYRKRNVVNSAVALVAQQDEGCPREMIAKAATDLAENVADYEEFIENSGYLLLSLRTFAKRIRTGEEEGLSFCFRSSERELQTQLLLHQCRGSKTRKRSAFSY